MKRHLGAALLTTGALIVLTGCHADKTASAQDAGGIGQNLPSTSPTASAAVASGVSMRVANLFAPDAKSGPALDLYDVQLTGQAATPIVSNLAYGAVSNYFTPSAPPATVGQPIIALYALPTGEDPVANKDDAQGLGQMLDDGSHAQVTVVLTSPNDSNGSGPLSGLSFSIEVEKGDDGNGSKAPVAPAPPDGQAEILADRRALPSSMNNSLYVMIDDSCTEPLNGDPNSKGVPELFNASSSSIKSDFALFATAPGPHQVSVVGWPLATAPPTCAQLTQKQGQVSVEVTAGQQVELYVYGTSLTDLHLVAAPIQP